MITCRFFSVLCLSLSLIAVPANAGWHGAEWGMTKSQVALAREDANKSGVLRGTRFETDYARFRVSFNYENKALIRVSLRRTKGKCEDIVAALFEQYGDPVIISDQVLFRLVMWHDAPNDNRIRLVVSVNTCDLHFEQYAEYADHDLTQPKGY